ncbi:MAG: hypothetical protein B6D55_00695 [Candidatus Omnitrophica bacterium 4484_70.2]|nr:MAG: hypothetical protein B6D55_00695 [Candidatus Omnitrophica bacterium 4484_70.2]
MKVEIKKLSGIRRIVNVEVDKVLLKEDRKRVYQDLGKELKVPGFRKGCAPLDILERHHGKFLKEKFLEWALPTYYERAIREKNITPAALLRIFDVELREDSLKFSFEVELKPQIEIEESLYKGIKIKEKKIEMKEEEYEKIKENMKSEIEKIVDGKIDDSYLARWYGYPNEDVFKEAMFCEIKSRKLAERREYLEEQIVSYLLKKIKVEIPQKTLKDFLERLVEEEMRKVQIEINAKDRLEKYRKDIENKLLPYARQRLKLFYILETIAKKENLKIERNLLYDVVISYILSYAQWV